MTLKITASVAAILLTLSGAAAQGRTPAADPFARADASFSRFPLKLPTTPQKIGRLTNADDCANPETGFDCEWQDEAGVTHVVIGKDVVAIKLIDVAAVGDRNITALNIGNSRARGEVLTKVRAFLPEIPIDCLEADKAGQGNGIASCEGSFDNGGWFKLLFSRDNQLVTARIDAFQIN